MGKNTTIEINLAGFSHIQKLRLQWIIDRLIHYGLIRREEVCEKFDVGTATVTSDFNRLLKVAPEMMTYNKSIKAYTVNHVKVKIKSGVY